MIAFITGIIYAFGIDYVIVNNNGIGYYINFSHPELLSLGETITIFTYQHFREDATVLYGFVTSQEQDFFTKLISVKGLGPKTAMTMLASCKYDELVQAIEDGNIEFLKRMPSVGSKTAQQIILDLKGKLVDDVTKENINEPLQEAIDGLKSLGYKNYEVNNVLKELKKYDFKSVDEYLKAGLKLLLKQKGGLND